MMDIIGVRLTQEQKNLVLEATTLYIQYLRPANPWNAQVLEEIKLHLENEESAVLFVDNMTPRFDLEQTLDPLNG
jgi:hypothetical protein